MAIVIDSETKANQEKAAQLLRTYQSMMVSMKWIRK
jgi:hypothetical protein